jgi:hypothetical protein
MNELPPLVSDEELVLFINIQLVALVSCGVYLTHIKFAGDRVGIAMDLSENCLNVSKLNNWEIKEETARGILPKDCKMYLVKHTAFIQCKGRLVWFYVCPRTENIGELDRFPENHKTEEKKQQVDL